MNLPALFGYSRLLALSSDNTFNVTDIASISGYTDRQVRRHVIELVEYGMLAVVVDSDGRYQKRYATTPALLALHPAHIDAKWRASRKPAKESRK